MTATAAVLTVTVQAPVPEQAPVQPAKIDAEEEGVAVNVTAVPLLKLAEQLVVQLIPAGELVTVPEPVPATVRLIGKDAGMKFALTEVAAFIVTVQVPVPVQAPLQPANREAPEVGVAVRVTLVPWMKLAEQVAPQLIPAGELVTAPEPVPVLVTVKAN